MKVKIGDLSGKELDYAVGVADGKFPAFVSGTQIFNGFEGVAAFEPTLNWWHCGEIIQKGCILFDTDDRSIIWAKCQGEEEWAGGSTRTEAASRAYVKAKLGKEFNISFPLFKAS